MPAAAQKIPAVPQELRVAKDWKPPRQSAYVELAVELTPSRPPRFGERLLCAKSRQKIAALSPLRLPIVRKPLAIAYGSAELPALVWDSKRFHDARSAANGSGELVAVDGGPFHHPGRTATAGWKTGEARSGAGGKVVLIKGSRKASLTQSTLPRTRPPWHRSRFARP